MKRARLMIYIVVLFGGTGAWLYVNQLLSRYRTEPYTEIEPGLFVGRAVAEPPPGTEAVINVCSAKDQYEVAHHFDFPIMDAGEPPKLEWVRKVVTVIEEQRKAKRQIYIHCAAGVSRSGMITTAYIMHKYGWSRDRALEYIRDRRPELDPRPAFMTLLSQWESEIKKK